MTTNVGTWDRFVRLIVGIALIVAPLINFMGMGGSSMLAYVLMAVGAILIVTAAVGFCPLYRIVGMSTSHTS